MPKSKYNQFVHECVPWGATGTRYAVGCYNPRWGQYSRPFDATERKLTGASGEYSNSPTGLQSYPIRLQALRRARYLFGGS